MNAPRMTSLNETGTPVFIPLCVSNGSLYKIYLLFVKNAKESHEYLSHDFVYRVLKLVCLCDVFILHSAKAEMYMRLNTKHTDTLTCAS